jgi:hypothetical protein
MSIVTLKKQRTFFYMIYLIIIFSSHTAYAKIPEPDNIIYGIANGANLINLKVNNQIIASYTMGSNPDAGNHYILKVPVDTLEPRDSEKACPGESASIFIDDNHAPAATLTIGERGSIFQINLKTSEDSNQANAASEINDRTLEKSIIVNNSDNFYHMDDPEAVDQTSDNENIQNKNKVRVVFTKIPDYGSRIKNLYGKITNIENNNVKMAVFLYENGWHTKPYTLTPLTDIDQHNEFMCDVTTSGYDFQATRLSAFAVTPNNYTNHMKEGDRFLPESLYNNSLAYTETTRNPKDKPFIDIVSVPPLGNRIKALKGKVYNVKNTEQCHIVVYIFTNNSWTIKPDEGNPFTKIDKNGAFSCDITRAYSDCSSQKIAVFLLPINVVDIPMHVKEKDLPETLYQRAISEHGIYRGSKSIP